MKKSFALILAILLSFSIVVAYEGIEIKEIDSNTNIYPDEIGTYTLEITNLDYRAYTLQFQGDPFAGLPTSDVEYVRIDPNVVVLPSGGSVEVEVEIKLWEDAARKKRYKTFMSVKSLGHDTVNEQYDLQIFLYEARDPIQVTVAEASETVAPGNDLLLSLGLENKLNEDLSNVDIYVTSDLFEDQQTVELFDDQERTVDFSFPIDNTVAPGTYSYSARVYYEDELSGSVTSEFSVEENLDVTEYLETVSEFLFKEVRLTKSNDGNSLVSESYDYDLNLIQGWFAAYNVEPSSEDGSVSSWVFNIEPGEDYTVVITVDYRPALVAVLLLLLLGLIVYYVFTKRVSIKKEVFKLKYSTDGLADFKVLLHVKNNTTKPIKDVTVIDRLPRVIQPSMEFGTLQPTGVQRGAKGIRMMWKISELVAGEERIISYKVKPRMSVIGRFTLPTALGKFKSKSKRVVRIRSNRAHVFSGVSESPEHKKRKAYKSY
tara:strand:+ start:1325 stop:2785 length:1461 start_codon:yes stop_codon:yes gene_type:complete